MDKICGTVTAVCISKYKGTQKQNIHSVKLVEDWGCENDAHAGKWHRQVSLLCKQKIDEFKARGAEVTHGDFGENIIVDGIDFGTLPIGTRLECNGCLLEMTQIGKECHHGCAIYQKMGDCIMPREGVFARVLKGGTISEGDRICVCALQ